MESSTTNLLIYRELNACEAGESVGGEGLYATVNSMGMALANPLDSSEPSFCACKMGMLGLFLVGGWSGTMYSNTKC